MSDYGSLFHLQEIDLNLDKQKALLENINASLNDNTTLDNLNIEVSKTSEALQRLQLKQKDLELDVTTLKDKFSLLSDRMYGGKLRNTKELASLQEEVTYLKQIHGDKEEELLEVLLGIESAEASLSSALNKLGVLTLRKKEETDKLAIEKTNITATIEDNLTARNKCADKIPASLLTLYAKIRVKKGGVVVSKLSMDMCGVCRVVIPSGQLQEIKRTKKPRSCDSCGRILIVS